MRKIRWATSLAVIAGVLGASAAGASAHSFESSGGVTRGIQIGTEEFALWPMRINCQKSASKGSAPAGAKETYTTETKYSICTAFNGGVKVMITPAAQWEYNANGTQTLLNELTVRPLANIPCHYSVPAQTPPTATLLFGDEKLPANTKFPEGQNKLNIYTKLKGLTYTATGWPCTGPKSQAELQAEKTEMSEGEGGSFVGANHEEVVNGNLTWVE
jgi:hypothetical protein